MDNIPEFIEPRFWVAPSLQGFGVFYRLDGRKLGVGCIQNVSEAVARNEAKALNDVVDDELAAVPWEPESALIVKWLECAAELDHSLRTMPRPAAIAREFRATARTYRECASQLRASRADAGVRLELEVPETKEVPRVDRSDGYERQELPRIPQRAEVTKWQQS